MSPTVSLSHTLSLPCRLSLAPQGCWPFRNGHLFHRPPSEGLRPEKREEQSPPASWGPHCPVHLTRPRPWTLFHMRNSSLNGGDNSKGNITGGSNKGGSFAHVDFSCGSRENTVPHLHQGLSWILPPLTPGLCGPEVCSFLSIYTPLKPHLFYCELPEKATVARTEFCLFQWPSCWISVVSARPTSVLFPLL